MPEEQLLQSYERAVRTSYKFSNRSSETLAGPKAYCRLLLHGSVGTGTVCIAALVRVAATAFSADDMYAFCRECRTRTVPCAVGCGHSCVRAVVSTTNSYIRYDVIDAIGHVRRCALPSERESLPIDMWSISDPAEAELMYQHLTSPACKDLSTSFAKGA